MANRTSSYQRTDQSDNTMQHVVYGLYSLAFLTVFTFFAGAVLAFLQRGNDLSALQRAHVVWQIRTFWLSMLFSIIVLAIPFLLSFLLGPLAFMLAFVGLLAASVWSIYRIVKGWYFLYNRWTIDNPTALL